MRPTTEKQIKNGLRVGGGIGLFWIAAMIIGVAIDGLNDVAPGHLRLWPDVVVASGLIGAAVLILALTARIWILYIAGCLLFAIPKFLTAAFSGRSLYSRGSLSGWQAAELVLFSLVSLFLIYRLTVRHQPSVVDRISFTFFLLALVFGFSDQEFALVAVCNSRA